MAFPVNAEEVRETLKRIQKNLECPICLELLSDPYSTQCSHPFCRSCIYMVISSSKEARCPLCKEPISKRSMNENARLADIVEAVKSLEQAVIKDSGIPSTPPRPLHQHSREASGTPGLILHSLLHPTPQKPAPAEAGMRLERQHRETEGCKPTMSSGAHPHQLPAASRGGKKLGLCPKQDLEKKFNFNPSRRRVRFASARSGRRVPGSGRASGGVDQAALLRALEEADLAEPERCGVASNPNLERRPGYGTEYSNTASTNNGGDRFGSSSTDTASTSPEPQGGHHQHEKIPPAGEHPLLSQKSAVKQQPVLARNQTVDSHSCQSPSRAVSMRENLTVVQETPFIANLSTRHSSDGFHGNNTGEPGDQAGADCHLDDTGTGVSTAITPVQTTAAVVVEETPLLRSRAAGERRLVAEEATASSDEILAKESQFADAVSTPAANASERTAPGTQTVEETQMNAMPSSSGVATSEATQPTVSGRRPQYSGEIGHSVSPTQCIGETQFLQTREGSNQRHDGTSQTATEEVDPGEDKASVSRSGDSTQSLSPPTFVRETPFQNTPPTARLETPFQNTPPTARLETPFQNTPPTATLKTPFQKTPPTARLETPFQNTPPTATLEPPFQNTQLTATPFQKAPPTACTSSSNRPIKGQSSSCSTTPDLQELQSSTALSSPPSSECTPVAGKEEETPICSSPMSTAVPVCRPCFTSPPPRGSCGCPAAPSPSLNHSISPSIPLQNQHQGTGSNQERVVIPDTFPDVMPCPSLEQTKADSVPSSQRSPVVALHSPALPGLYIHTSNASSVAKNLESDSSLSLAGSGVTSVNAALPLSPAVRDVIPAADIHTSNASSVTKDLESLSLAGSGVTPINAALPLSPAVRDVIPAGDCPGPSPTHHSDSVGPLSSDKETSPTAPTLSGSIPYGVTVIPDSLHPHSPEHLPANFATSPTPHATGNDEPNSVPASTSPSSEMQSPGSDSHTTFTSTYTQGDSTCKSYLSQGLTSQEVEALRVQMEEKQREIQELEALLLAKKSTNAAGDRDEGSPESDAVGPPNLDCSEPIPQPSSGQEPRRSSAHKGDDHTPSPTNSTQCSVTVIAETVPDSLPPCNALGPVPSANSQESNSAETRIIGGYDGTGNHIEHKLTVNSATMQPSSIITQEGDDSAESNGRGGNQADLEPTAAMQPSSIITQEADDPAENNGREGNQADQEPTAATQTSFPTGENVGPPIATPTPPATDQQQAKTKLLLQKAEDLTRALQCPPSVGSPPPENQDPGSTTPEHGRPSVMGPNATPPVRSGAGRKRKIGSLEHGQENTSATTVPPKRTKASLIDRCVTRPRPVAALSSVLQSADQLLKALRGPPKIVLESQTTMEVDTALASSTAEGCDHAGKIVRNSSSKKKKTLKDSLRRPKDGLPAKSKRRAPLIVLDSQDVETQSPPLLDVPLPDNHPFLSVSTSKRQQTSVIDLAGTPTMPHPTSQGCQPMSSHLGSPRKDTSLKGYQTASGQPQPSERGGGGGGGGPSVVMVTPGVQLSGGASPAEILKSSPQTPSFVGSGLSKLQLKQAQILAKMYGGRIASCFNGSTTHVIVLTDENGCCSRTVKYLQGLAAGRWIVGYEWVKDSLEAGQLLLERDYVALGDHLSRRGSAGAPLRARSRLAAGELGLFNRHNFLLVGQFTATSSDCLAQLVQLGGGRVVTGMDDFLPPVGSQTLAVCDQLDDSAMEALRACRQHSPVSVTTSSWVLDSLSQYRLQPVEKYQLTGQ